MYGLCLLSNYVFFMTLVPILAHWEDFRTQLLPRLAHYLHVSKAPTDQYLLLVGLVTIFVYFVLNLALDLVQTIRSLCTTCQQRKISTRELTTNTSTSVTTKKTTTTQYVVANNPNTTSSAQLSSSSSPCNVSIGLTRAHQQAVHYYPAFVTSTFLIWSNTNKFDSYSIAFVMLQVLFLLMLPFSYMCPRPLMNHINRIAYQCALLWTLAYAIYPRDVGYLMDWAANSLYGFFCPAPVDIYYTPIL
ncbi:hypothetical protein BC941DRAFT_416860 [Chlamydoabsidia padenii]|nr:hypothetical protein BC941DRAFT_416860 [Chlamydoabsidia padenii]